MANNGQAIYQGFLSRGYTPPQAAALAGNVQQESSFNPSAWNAKSGAGGLMQWRLDRLTGLQSFAQAQGKPPTDPDVQMDFVVHEMQGPEARNAAAFLQAGDVQSANAALKKYVRYGDNESGNRLQNAMAFAGNGNGAAVKQYDASGNPIAAQPAPVPLASPAKTAPAPVASPDDDALLQKYLGGGAPAAATAATSAAAPNADDALLEKYLGAPPAAVAEAGTQHPEAVGDRAIDLGRSGAGDGPTGDTPAMAALRAQVAKNTGSNQPAPNVANNPLTSSLPGPIGQLANTSNALTAGMSQGITAGWGDEIAAGLMTPIEMAKNRTWDVPGSFNNLLQGVRQNNADATALNPQAAGAGDTLGSTAMFGKAPAGPAAAAASAVVPTVKTLAARGAINGAVIGGLNGVGRGDGWQDRLQQGAIGAASGAAVGGTIGAVAGNALMGPKPAPPALDALQTAKNAAYAKADALGVRYSPQGYDDLVNTLVKDAQTGNISVQRHPLATSMLADIQNAPQGYAPTLTQLDQLRQVIRRDVGTGDDAEGHFGRQMMSGIDDFIDKATPAQMVSGSGPDAAQAITAARDANSTYRKSELIQTVIDNAGLKTASTGSGGNINNALRQGFRSILTNPKKIAAFSPEERAAMESLVRGNKIEDALRLVGKLSPVGNGLMAALGIGATATNPLLAAAPIAGAAAKYFADRATIGKAEGLQALVGSGGNMLTAAPAALTGAQNALFNTGTGTIGGSAKRLIPSMVQLHPVSERTNQPTSGR